LIKIAANTVYIEVIMKRKLFFILTTVVLLIAAACSGSFIDPGMMDQPDSGGFGNNKDHGGGEPTPNIPDIPTAPTVPSVPSNVTASAQSSHSIKISWSAVSGARLYGVYRSTSANGTYEHKVSTSSTSYTDNGLPANTTYYYKVSAYNNQGESDKSSTSSAKTSPPGDAEKNPIPLTENKWEDGEITSSAAEKEIWYSFDVTNGTTYYVWWNDRDSGDNTKTLDVRVDAYYINDSSIFYGVDSGWNTAQSFKANSTGKVKLRVYPYSGGNGTFAITYSTINTRPTPYTVTFNSNGGSGTPPASQTVNTGSSITLPDAGSLSKSGCTFAGWSTAASGGTYYKKGDSYTVKNNITLYAVWISALTGDGTKANPFQLNANTWADGVITPNTANKEIWYSFVVTQDTTYYVWWNDSHNGDDSKTLIIKVSAYYSDDSNIFEDTVDKFDTPKSITASLNDTVKIKVQPFNSGSDNSTGTFAIVFNESGTRP
jgi:hypothetical protein